MACPCVTLILHLISMLSVCVCVIHANEHWHGHLTTSFSDVWVKCVSVCLCLYSTRIQNGAITLTVSDIDVLLQQSIKVSNGTMNLDFCLIIQNRELYLDDHEHRLLLYVCVFVCVSVFNSNCNVVQKLFFFFPL